jgi:hypothetical protein
MENVDEKSTSIEGQRAAGGTVPCASLWGLPLLCAAYAIREQGGVAPVLWADADADPRGCYAIRVG